MDELGREDKLEYLQVVILLYYKYWISKKVTVWVKGVGFVPSFQIFQFLTYEGVNPTPFTPFDTFLSPFLYYIIIIIFNFISCYYSIVKTIAMLLWYDYCYVAMLLCCYVGMICYGDIDSIRLDRSGCVVILHL